MSVFRRIRDHGFTSRQKAALRQSKRIQGFMLPEALVQSLQRKQRSPPFGSSHSTSLRTQEGEISRAKACVRKDCCIGITSKIRCLISFVNQMMEMSLKSQWCKGQHFLCYHHLRLLTQTSIRNNTQEQASRSPSGLRYG